MFEIEYRRTYTQSEPEVYPFETAAEALAFALPLHKASHYLIRVHAVELDQWWGLPALARFIETGSAFGPLTESEARQIGLI